MSCLIVPIRTLCLIFVFAFWLPLEAQGKKNTTNRIDQPPLQKTYQVIIVGGGPAGLSCGQRCAKYGFSTLIITTIPEKNLQSSFPVPNWPGLPNKSWSQIIDLLKVDFTKSGGTYFEGEVSTVTKSQNLFYVLVDKEIVRCDICVIATGKKETVPECKIAPTPPSRTLMRFYTPDFLDPKDTVALIGDDEHTLQIALELSNIAAKVCILSHTRSLETKAPAMEVLQHAPNVQFISYDRLLGITNQTKNCLVEYSKNNSKLIQTCSWAIFTDIVPAQSEIARRVTQIDSKGAIVTCDSAGSTHTPGLYSCGEVTSSEFFTGAFASAAGARTGSRICRELLENGVIPVLKPKLKQEDITVEQEQEAPSSTK
jgi:thioredoxin reductase